MDEEALGERFGAAARKAGGIYFTPSWLVQRVLDAAAPYAREPLAVIDPACGAGAFLAAARERFPAAKLFGCELSAESARECRARVPDAVVVEGDALRGAEWPRALKRIPGRSEGKFLELFLKVAAAKKVVEVGTLAGYSAIRIARALPAGGKLWTIEFDPRHAEVAKKAIAAAGLAAKVEVLTGAGLDVLPTLERHGPFDAVFIDADKGNYDGYGRWAGQHLRPGGLLLGDNAYYFGKLLDDHPEAAAMRRFHEEAAQAFDTVCIPTPDGLLLGIKQ